MSSQKAALERRRSSKEIKSPTRELSRARSSSLLNNKMSDANKPNTTSVKDKETASAKTHTSEKPIKEADENKNTETAGDKPTNPEVVGLDNDPTITTPRADDTENKEASDDEIETAPNRRQKWALLFREGKGDLWSSSFRIACRDKSGPAWERDLGKPPSDLSDAVLNALMDNFDSQKIDRTEFMEALFSPLLKLNLSAEEKDVLAIMYDVNKDKKVSLFIKNIHQKSETYFTLRPSQTT